MKERYSFRKVFITAVTAAMLGLLYCVIFGFSAQNAEESGSISQLVSARCAQLWNSFSGDRWNADRISEIATGLEHPLRKIAHFSEYACMGVLVYILLSQWTERGRKRYLMTAGWVFLSAAGDELHQYFVPGRYASIWDVLLDTWGGVSGMLFCMLIAAVVCRRRKRKNKKVPVGGS